MPTTNRTKTTPTQRRVAQLRQARILARVALGLGVTASLAANIAASEPTIVARVVAGWSPVALLIAIELAARVPSDGSWSGHARTVATATIAVIAGWISYWHMVEVALGAGESAVSAHLLPFAVDGLITVATVSLDQIAKQLAQPTRRWARKPKRQATKPVTAKLAAV